MTKWFNRVCLTPRIISHFNRDDSSHCLDDDRNTLSSSPLLVHQPAPHWKSHIALCGMRHLVYVANFPHDLCQPLQIESASLLSLITYGSSSSSLSPRSYLLWLLLHSRLLKTWLSDKSKTNPFHRSRLFPLLTDCFHGLLDHVTFYPA